VTVFAVAKIRRTASKIGERGVITFQAIADELGCDCKEVRKFVLHVTHLCEALRQVMPPEEFESPVERTKRLKEEQDSFNKVRREAWLQNMQRQADDLRKKAFSNLRPEPPLRPTMPIKAHRTEERRQRSAELRKLLLRTHLARELYE